jgi:hypothetical protein
VQLQLTFASDNGKTVQVQSTNASSVTGQTTAAMAQSILRTAHANETLPVKQTPDPV